MIRLCSRAGHETSFSLIVLVEEARKLEERTASAAVGGAFSLLGRDCEESL